MRQSNEAEVCGLRTGTISWRRRDQVRQTDTQNKGLVLSNGRTAQIFREWSQKILKVENALNI